MSKTKRAFDGFRANFAAKACDRALVKHADELIPMTTADGMGPWQDGSGEPTERPAPPVIDQEHPDLCLWVVRPSDVPNALERGTFGIGLATGRLKHSNLTGGADAHCGGELVSLGDDVIAVNGSSGRYGPTTRRELDAVVAAFQGSGYGVWNYGYDDETNRPFNFETGRPEWVK